MTTPAPPENTPNTPIIPPRPPRPPAHPPKSSSTPNGASSGTGAPLPDETSVPAVDLHPEIPSPEDGEGESSASANTEAEENTAHEEQKEEKKEEGGEKEEAEGGGEGEGEKKDEDDTPEGMISEKEFQKTTKRVIMKTLMKFFRPELINRFDDVVFFHPLRPEDLEKIVNIMLREPREMLRERDIELRLSDTAKDFLSKQGYNPAFGARPLRRAIQEYLEDPLSDLLIDGTFVNGDVIFIDKAPKKSELIFKKDIASDKDEGELDPFASAEESDPLDPFAEVDIEDNPGEGGGQDASEQEEGGKHTEQGNPENTPEDSPFANIDTTPPSQNPSSPETGQNTENPEDEKSSFFSKMFH